MITDIYQSNWSHYQNNSDLPKMELILYLQNMAPKTQFVSPWHTGVLQELVNVSTPCLSIIHTFTQARENKLKFLTNKIMNADCIHAFQ